VEVLNEAYDEKVIIKDQSLRNLKLDTQFDQEELDIVMQVLEATFEFTVTKKRNIYYITE
jgi:ferric-dicitrate binding protein FerR (iron transport regulator)